MIQTPLLLPTRPKLLPLDPPLLPPIPLRQTMMMRTLLFLDLLLLLPLLPVVMIQNPRLLSSDEESARKEKLTESEQARDARFLTSFFELVSPWSNTD